MEHGTRDYSNRNEKRQYSDRLLTRLRLRPTRCKEGGSGRAYEGYAEASPIEPLKRLVDPEGS